VLLTTKQKIMMVAVSIFTIFLTGILVNSCKKDPKRYPKPTFENFTKVKIILTGETGLITDNRVKYDEKRKCWKVKVKYTPEKGVEGKLKFLTETGTVEKDFFEKELELIPQENKYLSVE